MNNDNTLSVVASNSNNALFEVASTVITHYLRLDQK